MDNKEAVEIAVIPVAGLGTRFLPITKTIPKEMIPVVNKPLIQYAIDEAYASGIREVILVTAFGKQSIENSLKTCTMVFWRHRNQRGLLRKKYAIHQFMFTTNPLYKS